MKLQGEGRLAGTGAAFEEVHLSGGQTSGENIVQADHPGINSRLLWRFDHCCEPFSLMERAICRSLPRCLKRPDEASSEARYEDERMLLKL